MFKFNMDEYSVTVIRCMDQYNDYSIAYDVTIQIQDAVHNTAWTQVIVAGGDDETSIKAAFRKWNNNGWIHQL